MVRWPTSSSGACFCSLLVGCVLGCFRFSFFRALFCIDQLEPWNQIDVFGFKGRAMGLVFCFFPTTHKQEKEEFQIFSNKYFLRFLDMTICRTVFILTVNAFQQDTFCSFLLALRVRTMNFADLDMFYEGLLSMAPKGVWLPFSEVVHMAQGHSWSLEGCKVAAHMWSHLGGVELVSTEWPVQNF